MAEIAEIPAWIALFIGLYALGASVGEFRHPGFWKKMVGDLAGNNALIFLTGLFCIALGAAIYLVNPWVPGDWLAVIITAIGGFMALEGVLILSFGDLFLGFAARLMGAANRLWAALSALLGVALIVIALARLT